MLGFYAGFFLMWSYEVVRGFNKTKPTPKPVSLLFPHKIEKPTPKPTPYYNLRLTPPK